MDVEKEFLAKHALTPEKVFKVHSSSDPDVIYEVEVYSNGKLSCNCPAGTMKRECKHKIFIGKIRMKAPAPPLRKVDEFRENLTPEEKQKYDFMFGTESG